MYKFFNKKNYCKFIEPLLWLSLYFIIVSIMTFFSKHYLIWVIESGFFDDSNHGIFFLFSLIFCSLILPISLILQFLNRDSRIDELNLYLKDESYNNKFYHEYTVPDYLLFKTKTIQTKIDSETIIKEILLSMKKN